MMEKKITFNELGKIKIDENRNIVISLNNLGEIVIAQQVVVNNGNLKTNFFVKNAIMCEKSKIIDIRDMLNKIIKDLKIS